MSEDQGRTGRAAGAGIIAAALLFTGWTLMSRPGAAAAGVATRYDRVFGNIYYKVPTGYRAAQDKGGVIMVPEADLKAGETGRFLIITPGIALTSAMQAKFRSTGKKASVQAIAISAGNLLEDPKAGLADPQPCNDPSKDGYECYTLFSRSIDKTAGNATRLTQYVIVLSSARADIIMRIAYGSQARYDALNTGFSALVASIEPANGKAPRPSRLAPALPMGLAAITPKPAATQPAKGGKSAARPPAKTGGNCRIVTKQQCSFSNGFSPGIGSYTCLPYPQKLCN